jgi:hypothetical protein
MKLYESSKAKFEQIPTHITKVERSKAVNDSDTEKLATLVAGYANDLKAAFDQASRDAQEASESKGKRGSGQSVILFEEMAKQHEQAARPLQRRWAQIQRATTTGEIKIDKSIRAEKAEPIVKAIPTPFLGRVDALVGSFIDDLGPRSAEASLAASCVAPCSQKNWSACASCILSKGPAAIAAWNAFSSCVNANRPCDWKHPGNCARQLGCLYTLISKLA